jgi:hypothetical protein
MFNLFDKIKGINKIHEPKPVIKKVVIQEPTINADTFKAQTLEEKIRIIDIEIQYLRDRYNIEIEYNHGSWAWHMRRDLFR